jgi:phosphoribosyl-ATP pyrophosphohydrolase
MIEEMGEVISILKKRGEEDVMTDMELRKAMIEELCDVMMFFTDVLIEFGISPTEFTNIYYQKHEKNMFRDFIQDDGNYLR